MKLILIKGFKKLFQRKIQYNKMPNRWDIKFILHRSMNENAHKIQQRRRVSRPVFKSHWGQWYEIAKNKIFKRRQKNNLIVRIAKKKQNNGERHEKWIFLLDLYLIPRLNYLPITSYFLLNNVLQKYSANHCKIGKQMTHKRQLVHVPNIVLSFTCDMHRSFGEVPGCCNRLNRVARQCPANVILPIV